MISNPIRSVGVLSAIFLLLLSSLASAVPQLISIQGKLTNATDSPLSGPYNFTFKIYNVQSGGSVLWTESHTGTNNITVRGDGIFYALLGSITSLNLPFNESYWLEIQVETETLSPRHRLPSSPYTFRANISEDLECVQCVDASDIASSAVTASKIASGSIGTTHLADAAVTSAKLADGTIVNDDIAAGAAIAWSKLSGYNLNTAWTGTLGGGNITAGTIGATQLADGAVTSAKISDGTIVNADIADGTITGADIASSAVTASKIASGSIGTTHLADAAVTSAKLAGNLSLTGNVSIDSPTFFVDSTNNRIGIGTAGPEVKLHTAGSVAPGSVGVEDIFAIHRPIQSGVAQAGWGVFSLGRYSTGSTDALTRMDIKLNNGPSSALSSAATVMTLQGNGNVGIGTTGPLARLHAGIPVSDYSTYSFANTGAVITSVGVDHTAARTNALALMRDGTAGVVFAGLAAFDLSRWSADGVNARTQLDIRLADTDTNTLTDVLSLRSNGNVGIGTTDPAQKLEVAGSIRGGEKFQILDKGGGYPAVEFYNTTPSIKGYIVYDTANGVMVLNSEGTNTLSIKAGNVGIGTTPASKLHIIGDLIGNMTLQGSGSNNAARLRVQGDNANRFVDIIADGGQGITPDAGIGFQPAIRASSDLSTPFLIDYTNASNTSQYLPIEIRSSTLSINAVSGTGNVGIGTTDPKGRLHVVGSGTPDLNISEGAACSFIDAGATSFTACSSRDIKENIQPFAVNNILEKISSTPVYRYDFINGSKNNIGLLAEDFYTVLQRGDNRTVSGQDVQMALWLAVQQLTKENQQLKSRVDNLEAKIALLQSKLN